MSVVVRQTKIDASGFSSLAAAIAAAPTGSKVVVPKDVTVDAPVVVTPGLNLHVEPNARIFATHAGDCLVFNGHRSTEHRLAVSKTGNRWFNSGEQTSVGVRIDDTFDTNFEISRAEFFGLGGVLVGSDAVSGVSYCEFRLGYLSDNRKNLWLASTASGYSNQNTYYGGRCRHSSSSTDQFAGTAEIHVGDRANGNVFVNMCVEGNRALRSLLVDGDFNSFYGGRYESAAPIELTASSSRTLIDAGYGMFGQDDQTASGVQLIDTGLSNLVRGYNGSRLRSNGSNFGQRSGFLVTTDSDTRSTFRAENPSGDINFEVVGRTIQLRGADNTVHALAVDSSGRLTINGAVVGGQS